MEFFRFFSAPSPHPSVPFSAPRALSKFLQTFCILAVCHFAVAWQWSDKTKDVAGCMANGLQEESSALLRPRSCSALALLLLCLYTATALRPTSSYSTPARQSVSCEWATDSPKLCSPATACYAHADERRRFCFFFVVPLLSCHCCYFLLLLAIKSMFGQQLACAIHSLYSL